MFLYRAKQMLFRTSPESLLQSAQAAVHTAVGYLESVEAAADAEIQKRMEVTAALGDQINRESERISAVHNLRAQAQSIKAAVVPHAQ